MRWLSNPKVRLALIVNGLYFISLFATPLPRHGRPPDFITQVRARREAVPRYVLPPPSITSSRVNAYESGGRLYVSLNKDMTLFQGPDRKVVLLPSFSVSRHPPEEPRPDSVLLNFIIYAKEEMCPGDCPLTIAADGRVVWPDYRRPANPAYPRGWQRERFPASSTEVSGGRVIETMAAESLSMRISYEQFLDTISASRVVIELGPDRVELTADQIEALRDMHHSLPQPPPHSAPNSY